MSTESKRKLSIEEMRKQHTEHQKFVVDRERELQLMEAGVEKLPLWRDFVALQREKYKHDITMEKMMKTCLEVVDRLKLNDKDIDEGIKKLEF